MIAERPRKHDDAGDIRSAQGGDLDAFERLYHAHVGSVHALCLRMTTDGATAEELTQETFVRAWQKLATYRDEGPFCAWLHRLAANVVLTDMRSRDRRGKRLVPVSDPFRDPPQPVPETPNKALDLKSALATLPEGARAVFLLHDVHGYRHGEIARITGTSPGTSKAQLHRARRLLREVLQ